MIWLVLLFSIALLMLFRAFTRSTPVPAPRAPDRTRVTAIRVVRLVPSVEAMRTISDPRALSNVLGSSAFGEYPWVAADVGELVPLYRFDFLEEDHVVATYYFGANSYPARFPCYSFCSGWWLGAARADATFDPTRSNGLTETQYFPIVKYLTHP